MSDKFSYSFKDKVDKGQVKRGILTIFIMGILSFLLMAISFFFSTASFDPILFRSYFQGKWLMLMNFIPIFLTMNIFALLFNKLWISFSISSGLLFAMSTVNKFKLMYRDEPFMSIDLKLFTEAGDMASKYDISPNLPMIIILSLLVLISILLKFFVRFRIDSKKTRFSFLALILITSIVLSSGFYFNPDTYERIGNKDLINPWSQTQQFQSKGFIYPFIYSLTNLKDRQLEGYDENIPRQVLEKFHYHNIEEGQKVNIIAIMLEAYNDFSKFDTIDIDESVYEKFHSLQEESLSGRLVTNVFAGGTVNTEWGFLNGYNSHPRYLKNTNGFPWYFKEQGYKTETMHPNYGWFYNRRNVNEYIGFDNFDYYENKYEAIDEDFLDDKDFFKYIIEGYENSKKDNIPYFHFSTTYQNHGPYSDEDLAQFEYLKKNKDYTNREYNFINNYLAGIKETGDAMEDLIDYYRQEDEPTIVIFFGDHNPWLGEDNSGYKMMGIDMDLSTEEGFLNYYETPYIIWGNKGAKEAFGKDFIGEMPNISPNFLMAELFEYLGWEGNEYMGYLQYVKNHFDVNHDMYFKEDGKYTRKLSEENYPLWKEFNYVQYYHGRNFKD